MTDTDKATVVVGASRGLGRGIASALAEAGGPVIAAYTQRSGRSEQEYLGTAPRLTPETAGAAVVELVRSDPTAVARAYRLTGGGLQRLP